VFFVFCFRTMQNFTGQTIPFTLSWNKVTYQNPGLEYDDNLVCDDFLNMGMLPLECVSAGKRRGNLYIYIYIYIPKYLCIYIYLFACVVAAAAAAACHRNPRDVQVPRVIAKLSIPTSFSSQQIHQPNLVVPISPLDKSCKWTILPNYLDSSMWRLQSGKSFPCSFAQKGSEDRCDFGIRMAAARTKLELHPSTA